MQSRDWSSADERAFNLKLAAMIEAYWRAKGHQVEVSASTVGYYCHRNGVAPQKLTSNTLNGLPQTQADRSL